MRGWVAVTDFFPGGSLAPIGVTVSFLSATAGEVLDRLVTWRESLGQQVEINENRILSEFASVLDPLESPLLARSLGIIRLPEE
jgi:hypothetical protein